MGKKIPALGKKIPAGLIIAPSAIIAAGFRGRRKKSIFRIMARGRL